MRRRIAVLVAFVMALALAAPLGATGTGFYLDYNGGTPRVRVGNPSGNRLVWDGSTLTIVGDGSGLTSIDGGNIQTGTVTATKLNVATLSAITANLGTVMAGSINVGSTNHLWLNNDATYSLAIGGTSLSTAPFRVTWQGAVAITYGVTVSATANFLGDVYWPLSFRGSGNQYLCVDNAGKTYASAGGC